MPSWYLEDASATAHAHPYTFYKPSAEIIGKIKIGEMVKLIFCFESDDPKAPRAERMWVLVDGMDGYGGFTGKLDNEPCYIQDLQAGNAVVFRDIHIIDTEHGEPGNVVEKYTARCFVTHRVLLDGAKVGYLYREAPEYENDSGWRLMAGDESTEYMDDAANIAYVSLGAVLDKDDSFVDLLGEEVDAQFEHDDGTGAFVRLA